MLVDATYKAGSVLEILQFNWSPPDEQFRQRGPKLRLSDAKKIKLNLEHSRRNCARLINENFSNGGVWIGLDYDDEFLPADWDGAIKNVTNFLRRLRALRKKLGLSALEYIVVTEELGGRLHHHVITNGIDYHDIKAIWTLGGMSYSAMDRYTDYINIANYITKERRQKKYQKKWMQSKNLRRPTPVIEPAKKAGEVKIPRGYKELERTLEAGEFGACIYVRAIKIQRNPEKKGGKQHEKRAGTSKKNRGADPAGAGGGKKPPDRGMEKSKPRKGD